MKIRCDVCDKVEATVFCSADEAALCDGCDRKVHFANKLAGKHLRFSLLHPSLEESPLCDICQERRAYLFCREDRAILCRECDIPIHKANEHTQKHNRFLLTGVKLSASSSSYPTSPSSNSFNTNLITTNTNTGRSCQTSLEKTNSVSSTEIFRSPFVELTSPSATYNMDYYNQIRDNSSVSTISMSEYLETSLGWQVDDFLDPSNNGFCKVWSTPYM